MELNPYEPPQSGAEKPSSTHPRTEYSAILSLIAALSALAICVVWFVTWLGIYDPVRDDGLNVDQILVIRLTQAFILLICLCVLLLKWINRNR
jgi:hypothetical protein